MMAGEGHGEKLSRQMEHAISSLLSEPTIVAAAKATGVSEATLGRWLKDDDFAAAYLGARRAALSSATARLHEASSTAVATLEAVMTNTEAPASARVSAARTVLEMATRAVEIEDLAERLGRIERLLESEWKGVR